MIQILPIKMAQLLPSLSWVVLKVPTQQWTISIVLSWSWRAFNNAMEFWIAWPILLKRKSLLRIFCLSRSRIIPVHITSKDGNLNMSSCKVVFTKKLNFINHGLKSLFVRRTLSKLPTWEVIKMSQRCHTWLCVSHHHNVTGFGCMGTNNLYLNNWVA